MSDPILCVCVSRTLDPSLLRYFATQCVNFYDVNHTKTCKFFKKKIPMKVNP